MVYSNHMSNIVPTSILLVCLVLLGAGGWLSNAAAADIDQYIKDAASGSQAERLLALDALGSSGELRALPALVAAAQDPDPTIRERARLALQTLVDRLRGMYQTVAQWIDTFLVTLGWHTSPPLPVEKTQHTRFM